MERRSLPAPASAFVLEEVGLLHTRATVRDVHHHLFRVAANRLAARPHPNRIDGLLGAWTGRESVMFLPGAQKEPPPSPWLSPEVLSPLREVAARSFAVAEDNGVALPLTRHLFRLIQRDLQLLSLPPAFHIGVNITADHLASPDMIADVHRLQQGLRALSPRLVLEITERKVVPDTDLVQKNMPALRTAGVQFATDDFGTGHSSLAYLERFSVDYIKIDRGFVSAIGTDAVNAPVLELIIALGARLGVTLIAEGIETETQAAYLRGKGVKYAQGFLFARPMSAEALRSWIDNPATGDRSREMGRL
ncbi:EAL domain-containing protein [Cupriavidus sp. CP313]